MKIYVVNLARRPDRLAFMDGQLQALGLPYTRINAVDGLGEADIGYPPAPPRLSKPEYACYLSHVACWQAILDSGDQHALILEDDVVLAKSFAEILAHAPFFEHSGAVTRLECRIFRAKVSKFWRHRFKGRKLRRLTAFEGGTGAIVITRAYAAYLLENHAIPEVPVDDLVLDPISTRYRPHTIYQLDPAPATQRIFLPEASPAHSRQSDLQETRTPPPSKPRPRGVRQMVGHELRRRGRNLRGNLFHTSKVIRFDED